MLAGRGGFRSAKHEIARRNFLSAETTALDYLS